MQRGKLSEDGADANGFYMASSDKYSHMELYTADVEAADAAAAEEGYNEQVMSLSDDDSGEENCGLNVSLGRYGMSPIAVQPPGLSLSGHDLCSSDPSRLYSPVTSLNDSLEKSNFSLHSNRRGDDTLDFIGRLSEEDATRLLHSLLETGKNGATAKDVLLRLARGESFLPSIKQRLRLPSLPICPWNERFQALLDLPDGPAKHAAISNLGADFVHASSTFARIIIEELYLPYDQKTIKPVSAMGGIHGGTKFCQHGILFKFAVASADSKDLFGGDDAKAMKTAGHELKSLVSIFNANIPELRTPLMCIVDYRGFRVLCVSVLPISDATLRYGSSDGGRTVHDDDMRLSALVKQLGATLGLKRHRGADRTRNDVWFKLLRCEAVRSYGVPLSSDALSAWGAANAKVNNREVRLATEWLHDVLVPKCAAQVDEMVRSGVAAVNATFRVKDVLHQMGINCRLLGMVRSCCMEDLSRELLLTELIARVIKCHVNAQLRALMAKLKLPVDQPYRHLLVGFINIVLGNKGEKSLEFWTQELKELIRQKFGGVSLLYGEALPHFDLRESISGMIPLIRRVLQFLGVSLTKQAQGEFVQAFSDRSKDMKDVHFRFVDADILSMNPRVKQPSFVTFSTGLMLKNHGDILLQAGAQSVNEAIRMYNGADSAFKRAVSSCATSNQMFESWASLALALALIWTDRHRDCESQLALLDVAVEEDSRKAKPIQEQAEEAITNARLNFDKCANAWAQAFRLKSQRTQDAWDVAADLKVRAGAAPVESVRRGLFLYGAVVLYQAIYYGSPILQESPNFLFEYGDVCRAASVENTGNRFKVDDLVTQAAHIWEKCFALDMEKRFLVWDLLCTNDPTKDDRAYLSSLVMVGERSEAFFEDLVQVFYNRHICDFSGVKLLNDDPIINLFSDRNFNVSQINLNHCPLITGKVFQPLRQCEFLTEMHVAGTMVDDSAVRYLSKHFMFLEVVDLSDCAKITDASLLFLGTLPHLRMIKLRACDLSDRAVLEALLPQGKKSQQQQQVREVLEVQAAHGAVVGQNPAQHKFFPNLQVADLSHVSQLTYSTCFRILKAQRLTKLVHTATPLFMARGKVPASILSVSESGLSVTWKTEQPLMARANSVIPHEEELFYFEVEVVHAGREQAVGIGIARRGHVLNGMPGWYSGSYGFHGDDGCIFQGQQIGEGQRWGPKWGVGDRVGLGLHRKQESAVLFFTKNGKNLGVAFENVPLVDFFFPVVGSVSNGAHVNVFFDSSSWRFDAHHELIVCKGDWSAERPDVPMSSSGEVFELDSVE